MKKIVLFSGLVAMGIFTASFTYEPIEETATEVAQNPYSGQYYGDKFKLDVTMSAEALAAELEKSKEVKNVVVEGTVANVCQAAGCWLKLDMGNGKLMHVMMKGHKFYVPKDLTGTIVLKGTGQIETTSVERLRHYAEDAGKSAEEIAKITEPKVEMTFYADGVYVR